MMCWEAVRQCEALAATTAAHPTVAVAQRHQIGRFSSSLGPRSPENLQRLSFVMGEMSAWWRCSGWGWPLTLARSLVLPLVLLMLALLAWRVAASHPSLLAGKDSVSVFI